ncbi:MAG: hypothetical protein DWP97_13450 [Calditrichaeota bacterium]|nr:MAG: hypothetical protein DWP97_13450 [Calditrichota bacterium]
MNSRFNLDFIDRTLKTTALVLLISLVFGMYYFGFWNALAFFSGGIFGMVNMMLLKRFVQEAFRPEKTDTASVIMIALVKFPLLYVSGYFLLTIEQFSVYPVIYGFTLVLAVLVLKALGRVFLGLDTQESNNRTQKVI